MINKNGLGFMLLSLFILGCSSAPNKTPQTDMPVTTPVDKAVKAPVAAVTVKDKDLKTTECKKGKDVRSLFIETVGSGCSLKYSKFGKTTEIASSEHSNHHCEETSLKTKSKLEKSGFVCQ